MRSTTRSSAREEELAALADGSLDADRRPAVEALAGQLAERLSEQRRAGVVVRRAAASVEGPAPLRGGGDALRPERAPPVRPYAWAGGAALAVAALAFALVFALPTGVPGGPTVAEAALLAARPPTSPPPAAASPALLDLAVEDV